MHQVSIDFHLPVDGTQPIKHEENGLWLEQNGRAVSGAMGRHGVVKHFTILAYNFTIAMSILRLV